jgi:hypothetical protein
MTVEDAIAALAAKDNDKDTEARETLVREGLCPNCTTAARDFHLGTAYSKWGQLNRQCWECGEEFEV